jgi:hypothetical protein
MNRLRAEQNDSREPDQIDALLAEAGRKNKALVRREMGLP